MGGHAAWRKRVARGELAKGAGGAIVRHRPHFGRKGKDLILNRKGHIAGGNPKKKRSKDKNRRNDRSDDNAEQGDSSDTNPNVVTLSNLFNIIPARQLVVLLITLIASLLAYGGIRHLSSGYYL